MTLSRIQGFFFYCTRAFLIILLSVVTSFLTSATYSYLHTTPKKVNTHSSFLNSPAVLGIAATLPTPTPIEIMAITPIPSHATIYENLPIRHLLLNKSTYTIALYGDSMEDTMGDRVDALSSVLIQMSPTTHFIFYNYGVGAQNVEQGLNRFDAVLTYKGRNYPTISDVKPDIIIIGSYAYNPFSPPDPTKHEALLTRLVQRAKGTGAAVYLLAEIAPLGIDFGSGPSGMPNWTAEYRLSHAKAIVDQMQNVFTVAQATNTPVIDVYDKTKINGPFGSWAYTNKADGIHPSDNGHLFTAQQIAYSIF